MDVFLGAGRDDTVFSVARLPVEISVGQKVVIGFDTKFQIINVYFSASYKLGRSMFIVSQGFTNVIASIEEARASRTGSASAISYVFNTGSRFVFCGQARLQGRGLMLSAGVGF